MGRGQNVDVVYMYIEGERLREAATVPLTRNGAQDQEKDEAALR